MKKPLPLLAIICALSLALSACSEDSKTDSASQASTAVAPTPNNLPAVPQDTSQNTLTDGQAIIEQTANSINQAIQHHTGEINQSLGELSQTLSKMSDTYENDYKVDENDISQLAKQLERLARQAGEGARTLEKTTKTIGEAIQKGFEEGYQKPQNTQN